MGEPFDVLIVGAGIAGSALAHALSTLSSSTPLRIALLERSLAEPDRIVGELLQPGGVRSLQKLGLRWCLDDIDAIPTHGYCIVHAGEGREVHIPYPDGFEGRSFHHGRFIMRLREAATRAVGVEVIEATATELLECLHTHRVLGVRAQRKDESEKEIFFAHLVIIADGCFSNFRTAVLGDAGVKPSTRSFFFGAVLEDAVLPRPQHGTVGLVPGSGPVLLYQIGEHDTRILIDIKQPLPSDIKSHILTRVVPFLPAALHLPIQTALSKDRLRRMPNSFLPPTEQGGRHTKEGVMLLGDAWNMRHPLTGGGMTVALNDVVMLQELFGELLENEGGEGLGDWEQVSGVLHRWHWRRKGLAATINILSVALYDLFGADGPELEVLRTGCFNYLGLGGECLNGPVTLLAGIAPSPLLLAYHFFVVAFYSLWVLFTHPRAVPSASPGEKPTYIYPQVWEYPALLIKSISVFWTACVLFGPLVWSEIQWW